MGTGFSLIWVINSQLRILDIYKTVFAIGPLFKVGNGLAFSLTFYKTFGLMLEMLLWLSLRIVMELFLMDC